MLKGIFEIIVTKLFNLILFDDEISFKSRYHRIKTLRYESK